MASACGYRRAVLVLSVGAVVSACGPHRDLRVRGDAVAVPERGWLAFRFTAGRDQLRYHRPRCREPAWFRLGAGRRYGWRYLVAHVNLSGQQDRGVPAAGEEGSAGGRTPGSRGRSQGTAAGRGPVSKELRRFSTTPEARSEAA